MKYDCRFLTQCTLSNLQQNIRDLDSSGMLDLGSGSTGGDDSSNAMQFPLLAQSYSISSERYDLLEDNGGGGNKRNHTADMQVTSTLMIETEQN